jgi:hypothetical protein
LIWIENHFFAVVQSLSACSEVCCATSNRWRWTSLLLLFELHWATWSYYAATRTFSNSRRYSLDEDTSLSSFSILSSRFNFSAKSWWWWWWCSFQISVFSFLLCLVDINRLRFYFNNLINMFIEERSINNILSWKELYFTHSNQIKRFQTQILMSSKSLYRNDNTILDL